MRESIVSGTRDTAHSAVVGLFNADTSSSSKYGTCSGTIVSLDKGIGIVLTAAHCCGAGGETVTPNIIVAADDMGPYLADMGNAHPKPPAFAVIPSSIKTDPLYDARNATHDFCLFEFWGATSDLTAIPPAIALDGLSSNAASNNVEFVGFGSTGGSSGANNMKRYHISRPLSAIDGLVLLVDESFGGPCQGDSGGPVLSPADGAENSQTVVGVISAGEPGCTGTAGSSRVLSATGGGGFITGYLAAPPTAPPAPGTACGKCCDEAASVGGGCFDVARACAGNGECSAIWSCASACAPTDTSCRDKCETAHPKGAAKYDDLTGCFCGNTCGAACTTECPALPSAPDAGARPRSDAAANNGAGDAPSGPASDSGGCAIQPASRRGTSALGGVLGLLALTLRAWRSSKARSSRGSPRFGSASRTSASRRTSTTGS